MSIGAKRSTECCWVFKGSEMHTHSIGLNDGTDKFVWVYDKSNIQEHHIVDNIYYRVWYFHYSSDDPFNPSERYTIRYIETVDDEHITDVLSMENFEATRRRFLDYVNQPIPI